jgi:4-amino-4-deoxy-L-arabinose transferase-like glycosyltransferase
MNFEPFFFFIGHYAFLIWVGILSYGIGRRLTQRIHFDHTAEQLSFCTTLGLGFLSYLILWIGTLGLLYRWLVITVMGVIFLLCSSAWIELFSRASSAYKEKGWVRWKPMVFILLAIVVIFPAVFLPLYPPTAFDSTMYHLACAKIYTQTHEIALTPYIRYPVFPQTNEMLFSIALLIYDGVAAQMIQFLMMMVLSVGLFAFGHRHFSQKAGIWAGAIFLSNPMVLWLGASAYIDIGLALFVTMAIYSLFNWIHLKEKRWLILGALFLGFSAGSKYSALFFLILFGFIVLWIGFKERRLFDSFLFLTVAIGVALPWYFRNWYYTGNPVFPFFSQMFGQGLWSPQDLQRQLQDLMHVHGTGKSLQSFLLLPWNLAFNQTKFLMEAPYSQIYLIALPFLFLCLRRAKIRESFIVLFLYTLFWFYTAQFLRYLIPVIPLLSLTIAASIENCLGFILPKRLEGLKKGILTLVISIALFSPGWFYTIYKVQKEGYPPYSKKEQEIYLTKRLPTFPAYQYLNQTRGRNYSLYALFDENMAYFADGIFMGDWFGPGRFEKIYSKFSNLKALHRELRSLGANYFLIRRVNIDLPREDDLLQSHFRLVYKDEHVLLFEVLE